MILQNLWREDGKGLGVAYEGHRMHFYGRKWRGQEVCSCLRRIISAVENGFMPRSKLQLLSAVEMTMLEEG